MNDFYCMTSRECARVQDVNSRNLSYFVGGCVCCPHEYERCWRILISSQTRRCSAMEELCRHFSWSKTVRKGRSVLWGASSQIPLHTWQFHAFSVWWKISTHIIIIREPPSQWYVFTKGKQTQPMFTERKKILNLPNTAKCAAPSVLNEDVPHI